VRHTPPRNTAAAVFFYAFWVHFHDGSSNYAGFAWANSAKIPLNS
jgi:hypothetical protein